MEPTSDVRSFWTGWQERWQLDPTVSFRLSSIRQLPAAFLRFQEIAIRTVSHEIKMFLLADRATRVWVRSGYQSALLEKEF
jgi:hypothetical protein